MLPIIALIGAPNVGKSTLYNQLTGTKEAIVADERGVTRDRRYGKTTIHGYPCLLVDTGGLGVEAPDLAELMEKQAQIAIDEADILLFVVDVKAGRSALDEDIAQKLRKLNKKVILILNKIDGSDELQAKQEFLSFGLKRVQVISALKRRGFQQLEIQLGSELSLLTVQDEMQEMPEPEDAVLSVAIIGRPNVGKSTLVNCLLGEERLITGDQPGVTRDSITVELEKGQQRYTLIDTAGIRRRSKVHKAVEKFSVLKAIQSIELAKVVVILIDADEGLVEQDVHLLGFALEMGRAVVLAVNKSDRLNASDKKQIEQTLDRKLVFAPFVPIHFISALKKDRIRSLLSSVKKVYLSAGKHMSTSKLTALLEQAVTEHQPPMINGRRIKLRYAHLGGNYPPTIVLHGNQTEKLPEAYQQYLRNFFRKAFDLVGTPIQLSLKTSHNPYKDQKNTLNKRQVVKRQRLIKRRKQMDK